MRGPCKRTDKWIYHYFVQRSVMRRVSHNFALQTLRGSDIMKLTFITQRSSDFADVVLQTGLIHLVEPETNGNEYRKKVSC